MSIAVWAWCHALLTLGLLLQGCNSSLSVSSNGKDEAATDDSASDGDGTDARTDGESVGDDDSTPDDSDGSDVKKAPKQPSVTVVEDSAAVLKIFVDGKDNPKTTKYALSITTGATTSWIAPDGTIGHSEPVWGSLEDFGGPAGLTLASQPTGSYTVTAIAKSGDDVESAPASAPAVAVIAAPPTVSFSQSSFTFTDEQAIASTVPTNSGGLIASCVASPTLPPGLSLSDQCVLSGTPTGTQTAANYTITAANAFGAATDVTISITVRERVPAIAFSGSPFVFTENTSVGTITPSSTGGSIASCPVTPTLPAGLSLSPSCVLTGTPSSMQSAATYTITPANGTGNGAAVTISIAVRPPLPGVAFAGSPFTFTRGISVGTITPTSSGGSVASCAASPLLPAGLSLSSACVISGTPTATQAAASYTITPTNITGSGTGVVISITVLQPVPAIAYAGSPFTFTQSTSVGTITPTNAGGTISSCDVDTPMPAGLSLSNACVITGSPTGTQNATTYTITPTNATGDGSDIAISIRILPALPAISYAGSPFSFTQNSSVGTITPTNSGGTIASCAVDPTLPTGLSLSSACVITGNPTTPQSATTYTLTPSNASGDGADVTISIEVVAAPTGGSLFAKVNASANAVGTNSAAVHLKTEASDALPDGPLLALWQADLGRSYSNNTVTFKHDGSTIRTFREPTSGTTSTMSFMGFKYFSSYDSASEMSIEGTTTAGTINFKKSSIYAMDLDGIDVYAPAVCSAQVAGGTNNDACTFTVPGGKAGETWLFLVHMKAVAAPSDQFTFEPTFRFNTQTFATPSSYNVESGWSHEAVIPYTFTFPDAAPRDLTFSYNSSVFSQVTAGSTYEVTVFGIDLTNVGPLIDYNRTGYAYWDGLTPFQTYSTKTINFPAAGNYLVLTYHSVESPQNSSTVRTSIGSTQIQQHVIIGGGSGQRPYVTTIAKYNASAPGNQALKVEYEGADEYAGTSIQEGITIVIQLD